MIVSEVSRSESQPFLPSNQTLVSSSLRSKSDSNLVAFQFHLFIIFIIYYFMILFSITNYNFINQLNIKETNLNLFSETTHPSLQNFSLLKTIGRGNFGKVTFFLFFSLKIFLY